MTEQTYIAVCELNDIDPNTGICALVKGEQVAIFRIGNSDEIYALGNFDPIGKANVLSRGLTAELGGELYVASPLYKQHYNLKNGSCLEDETVSIPTYPVSVVNGQVVVQAEMESAA